jgi:starch synthase
MLKGCAHTRYPRTLPNKYRNARRGRAALARSDYAISYSSAVDRHLAANGIVERAIVPYFPTTPPRRAAPTSARQRVVFGGRIVPQKGVDVLINAASEVDADFVLCGDGRDLEAMRELAAFLGIAERVRFRGWLDAGQLADELAEASLLVMPSVWPEPFGILGIEAFAVGRPAVASATGGIVDWLEHGVNGLAVPPADAPALAAALNELLADPARQQRMGAAGAEIVRTRFSAERHVATVTNAYDAARKLWLARRAATV